jgi:MFS family permease
MLSTIIPGILVGLIAGVVVDRANKKTVLVVTNFTRAFIVAGYLLYQQSLYAVYAVNFLFVGVSQLFGPAEASSIPALVPKRLLVTANSMFNLTYTLSQLVGIVLLAPWIIKFFGAPDLFILTAAIYVVAGILVSFLPPGVRPERALSSLRLSTFVDVARADLGEAWAFITCDRRTWWAMIFVTTASTLTLILAMLAPQYVVVEVGIQPEDAVFMVAPAGVGIFLMSLVMTPLARRFGEIPLAYVGGTLGGLALLGMAILPRIEGQLRPLAGLLPSAIAAHTGPQVLVLPLMVVSLVIGVGLALANIPSQALLMDRAPIQSRGRIFAALLLMGNVAAILPLAFLGALAQVFGVANVLGVVGVVVLAITTLGVREREATLPGAPTPVECVPSETARTGESEGQPDAVI